MADPLIVTEPWGVGHCTEPGPPPPPVVDVELSDLFGLEAFGAC